MPYRIDDVGKTNLYGSTVFPLTITAVVSTQYTSEVAKYKLLDFLEIYKLDN